MNSSPDRRRSATSKLVFFILLLAAGVLVLLLGLAALLMALSYSPTKGIAPPPGLVSWWRGEGNASDSAGTNNGILQGGVAFVAGEVGQAFSFDGSGHGYVMVADSPTLRFTNALTIECWAKRWNTSEVHVLVEKGGDWTGGETDFEIGLNDTYSGGSHFGFSSPGGWRGCAVTPDTAWHHYAAVAVSGQADPVLYIDGVPQTITQRGGRATMNLSGSMPVHIGAFDTGRKRSCGSMAGRRWICPRPHARCTLVRSSIPNRLELLQLDTD